MSTRGGGGGRRGGRGDQGGGRGGGGGGGAPGAGQSGRTADLGGGGLHASAASGRGGGRGDRGGATVQRGGHFQPPVQPAAAGVAQGHGQQQATALAQGPTQRGGHPFQPPHPAAGTGRGGYPAVAQGRGQQVAAPTPAEVEALRRQVERKALVSQAPPGLAPGTAARPQMQAKAPGQVAVPAPGPAGSSSSSARAPAPGQTPPPAVRVEIMQGKAPGQATQMAMATPAGSLPPVSSKAVVLAPRPGYGTAGRRCRVRANHAQVHLDAKDIYHYDVCINPISISLSIYECFTKTNVICTSLACVGIYLLIFQLVITPESASRARNRWIINELVELHKQYLGGRLPVYDGRKSLFTAGPLPFKGKEFVLMLTNPERANLRKKEYKVAIKDAAKLDLYSLQQFLSGRQREMPQEVIQALDIALREYPASRHLCDSVHSIHISATAFYKSQPIVLENNNCTADDYAKEFGIKVNHQLTLVDARVLPAPKVGGRNTVLEDALNRRIPLLTDVPTIIFGADVTHPSPGEASSPSIAAVVASMDWPQVTKYKCLVSSQGHRVEIIDALFTEVRDPVKGLVRGGMIRDLLISFRKSTGLRRERIIFYRDGVSEGQFSQVLLYEMDAIRKACASLEEGYLPRVTFVVVQKRHHTRLFPENHRARDQTDKSGNILPGTVVDTKICHPSEFNFYLCSHSGIKGTSRPAHYHVLIDENGFTADALQTLTYNLCYTYARCTRSVSIAYYAHLGAFRARYYLEDDNSDQGSSTGTSRTHDQSVPVKQLPRIKENVQKFMFYC
ncbi:hypothetical protein HU200_045256 [Digitaria exilis]|uniref:Piwi domain-containing protein n=1 Tax=Digitaria exilis TaxID=1010633 RepID=A0A835B047_9POAL|nr:hypothetical protein HU200_045256 [Digitaria exilis]